MTENTDTELGQLPRITCDEPGQRLALEGTVNALPRWAVAVPGLTVLIFNLLTIHPPYSAIAIASQLLIWAGMGLLLVLLTWRPLALSADANALVFVHRNLMTGAQRRCRIPAPDLLSFKLRAMLPAPPVLRKEVLNVQLSVRFRKGAKVRTRRFDFCFEQLDKRAEVADLAYRLGAAAGLGYQRVLQSDPQRIEIELGHVAAAGFTRAPSIELPADYAHNQVAVAALAAAKQDIVPPFDPARFSGPFSVNKWTPGRLVRFKHTFGLRILVTMLIGAAGWLMAAAAVVTSALIIAQSTLAGLLVLVLGGGVGVSFGWMAWQDLRAAQPRRLVIDWTAGTLVSRGWWSRRLVALDGISAIELRCVHVRYNSRSNGGGYIGYRCQLYSLMRGAEPMLLINTKEFRDDPAAPYDQALPLATELAAALGVPRRIISFQRSGHASMRLAVK